MASRYSQSGGFLANDSENTDSPSAKRARMTNQTLIPITLKQLQNIEEVSNDHFKLDGVDVSMITFIAKIQRISKKTTMASFLLEDGTGVVDARKFHADGEFNHDFTENQYVRVYGNFRTFQDKTHVLIQTIRLVENFNEITCHMLEVMNFVLHRKRQNFNPMSHLGSAMSAPPSHMAQRYNANNNNAGGYERYTGSNFTPVQQRLIDLIQERDDESGAHIDELVRICSREGLSAEQSKAALNKLLEEGHIFTADESHYKLV